MELLANLQLGFGVALAGTNILYCLIGVMLGTLIGVLPGIGPVATIAMLLPATFVLPPVSALIMLAGIYYGASYGGSTTAILVNLPGRGEFGGHLPRRLPDGPPGPRRQGARHRGDRLVLRRHRRDTPGGGIRPAARGTGPEVRPRGLLLAHGAGPHRGGGAGARLAHQGDRHDRAGPPHRPHRHRRELGRGPLQLRPAGADRRRGHRPHRHGRVRLRRDHPQPRARPEARRLREARDRPHAQHEGPQGLLLAHHPGDDAWIGPRHPARRRPDPGFLLGLHAREEAGEGSRRVSARARSRAWRHRKRPTTPRRRPPSSRSSRWASRPTR